MDRRDFFKGAAFFAALVPVYNLIGNTERDPDPKSPVIIRRIVVNNSHKRAGYVSLVNDNNIRVSSIVWPYSSWTYCTIEDPYHAVWSQYDFKIYTSIPMEWIAIYIDANDGNLYMRSSDRAYDIPMIAPRVSRWRSGSGATTRT